MKTLVAGTFLMFATLAMLPAPAAADEGCRHNGRFACYVVEASVRGYQCAPTAQEDLGGIGASTAREAAERTARINCAEEYSALVLGVRGNGNIAPDGLSENMPVRPAEVEVR